MIPSAERHATNANEHESRYHDEHCRDCDSGPSPAIEEYRVDKPGSQS